MVKCDVLKIIHSSSRNGRVSSERVVRLENWRGRMLTSEVQSLYEWKSMSTPGEVRWEKVPDQTIRNVKSYLEKVEEAFEKNGFSADDLVEKDN
jgi:ribosome-binding protein aMBF1 (putative translation factor)